MLLLYKYFFGKYLNEVTTVPVSVEKKGTKLIFKVLNSLGCYLVRGSQLTVHFTSPANELANNIHKSSS